MLVGKHHREHQYASATSKPGVPGARAASSCYKHTIFSAKSGACRLCQRDFTKRVKANKRSQPHLQFSGGSEVKGKKNHVKLAGMQKLHTDSKAEEFWNDVKSHFHLVSTYCTNDHLCHFHLQIIRIRERIRDVNKEEAKFSQRRRSSAIPNGIFWC